MNDTEFKQSLIRMEDYFTKKLDKKQAHIWWGKFRGYSGRDFDIVAERFIEISKAMPSYFPTIDQFRNKLEGLAEKQAAPKEPETLDEPQSRHPEYQAACAKAFNECFVRGKITKAECHERIMEAAAEAGIDIETIYPYPPSNPNPNEYRDAFHAFCAHVDSKGRGAWKGKRPTPAQLQMLSKPWMLERIEEKWPGCYLVRMINEVCR